MGRDVRRHEVCRGVGARTEEHEDRVDEEGEECERHHCEDLHTQARQRLIHERAGANGYSPVPSN